MTTVPVANPARKGEVVALDRQHEYHTKDMRRHFYTRFYIGVVEASSRAGEVQFVRLAGTNHATHVGLSDRVLTLNNRPGVQAAAKALFASITEYHEGYETGDDLRAAILAHMQGEA